MIAAVDSFRVYLWIFILCARCVNAGEPAAEFGFPVQVKVVERIQQESTAASSLLGWSLGGS
jgi:hypothetical protein